VYEFSLRKQVSLFSDRRDFDFELQNRISNQFTLRFRRVKSSVTSLCNVVAITLGINHHFWFTDLLRNKLIMKLAAICLLLLIVILSGEAGNYDDEYDEDFEGSGSSRISTPTEAPLRTTTENTDFGYDNVFVTKGPYEAPVDSDPNSAVSCTIHKVLLVFTFALFGFHRKMKY